MKLVGFPVQGTDRSSRYICLVAWEIDSLRSHNLRLFSSLSSLYVLFVPSITVFWHKFWHKKIPSPSLPSTLGCEKKGGICPHHRRFPFHGRRGRTGKGRTGWMDRSLSSSPLSPGQQIYKARDRDNSGAITCPALVNPHEGRACASSSIMTATSISSGASNANTINNNIVVLPEIPADTLLDGAHCRRRFAWRLPSRSLSKGHFAFDAGIRGNIAYVCPPVSLSRPKYSFCFLKDRNTR